MVASVLICGQAGMGWMDGTTVAAIRGMQTDTGVGEATRLHR